MIWVRYIVLCIIDLWAYHIFHTQFFSATSGTPLNLFYSTSPTINQLYNRDLRTPLLQSGELDDNGDGLIDRLEVGIQMPLGKFS